jgi:DNA polymerase-3 subunit epsilon/ATP-dependent DNA helicase DinG
MDSIVALDIETTGLDPDKDAILEIGAVRFNGNRIEAEFNELINPGRRIPPFITNLTGINDQMVLGAPPIKEVLPGLIHFVGNLPILGHNVRFDVSFLRKQGIFKKNELLDTYELASILCPTAGRYNLKSLAYFLGVPHLSAHRALSDAHATYAIYARLYDTALHMPIQLLAELLRLSEPIDDWAGYGPLHLAMRSRTRELVTADSVRHVYNGPIFNERHSIQASPLQPSGDPLALDPEEVSSILDQGGVFSHHFSNYEYRSEQIAMLRAVTEALSFHRHLFVEAGTGTGKSMAYLIPAALWAIHNNRRVVISTNTINLQEQLINKDIPDLINVLGLDIKAAVLKGRGNYICPRRVEIMRRRGPDNIDELRVLGKVLVWLQDTTLGDRNELTLNGPGERQVWSRLSAEDDICGADTCVKRTGGACPFYRARQSAQTAHLLIVNHALLLADVATGNRVLPEYEYLIIDEAHHLEEATTNALGFELSQHDVSRALRELGGANSGLLGWFLSATQSILQPTDYGAMVFLTQRATDYAFQLEELFKRFFESLGHFLYEHREGQQLGMYAYQVRILPATRTQPAWGEVELTWDETQNTLKALVDLLEEIAKILSKLIEVLGETDEELFGRVGNLHRRLYEIYEHVNALIFEPDQGRVYWVEVQPNGNHLSLHDAPLHIGALMEKYLWNEKSAVILTSATLTTAGEFDYLRGRLSAEDAYELGLGSPFDYENSALLYLVNDIPEPADRHNYQRAVEAGLVNLFRATGGRALVLFTSYDQLKKTSQAISSVLARENITIYEQGDGMSAHTLLESFRTADRAVLFGTRSFWEGVDVPGEALSVLVIVKLPFDVPSDPLVAARSETFDDPFYQYSLPEAILRFRQGFGRLIRTQSDRGIVAIFDRRVLSKKYGKLFIDSLPNCTQHIGSMADLPNLARKWLEI